VRVPYADTAKVPAAAVRKEKRSIGERAVAGMAAEKKYRRADDRRM